MQTHGRPDSLRLAVKPASAPAGRRTCFRFLTTNAPGAPEAGAKVRLGRRRGVSGANGRLRLCECLTRRGTRNAVAAKDGFDPARARVHVR